MKNCQSNPFLAPPKGVTSDSQRPPSPDTGTPGRGDAGRIPPSPRLPVSASLRLRPYQVEPLRAIVDSVVHRRGLTFTVMLSRQAGKNELSAQLELLLLTLFAVRGGEIVKASPTFKPQTLNSIERLGRRLDDWGLGAFWTPEHGYTIRFGRARAVFLSAAETANVVGHTASLLLECDEAQDVASEKWDKDFRPMAASTNATTVLYGTAWDDSTLLERTKQANLEAEQHDGIRRHFEYDWRAVAACNPDYGRYVDAERTRLGADHPLFVTQYELRTLRSGGGFLSETQLAQLRGDHPRLHCPAPDPGTRRQGDAETRGHGDAETQGVGDAETFAASPRLSVAASPRPLVSASLRLPVSPSPRPRVAASPVYVAGLDLAGEAETDERAAVAAGLAPRDSTVLAIGELDPSTVDAVNPTPLCRIVEIFAVSGRRHAELLPQLLDLLANVWQVHRVHVDATGVGHTVAALLLDRLGTRRVVPVQFTAATKSDLGYGLLAAVNAGRLKMYAGDDDQSREWWHQARRARSEARPNQTLRFYVPEDQGHDDYLIATALLAAAASAWRDRRAIGRPPHPLPPLHRVERG